MTASRKKLTVWILQTGEPMPVGRVSSRPMRAISLSTALVDAGHKVVIWTNDFNHFDLSHRYGANTRYVVSDDLEVRLVRSRGYSRNIGVERLVDHGDLALRLRRLLRDESPPDVAFVGFPPIETAAVMTRWLRDKGVPSIVDVKDAWPDVMLRAAPEPLRPVARVALAPYYYLTRRCLRDATGVSAPTEEFLEWSLRAAGRHRDPASVVFPLTAPPVSTTSPLEEDEAFWDQHGVRRDGRFRVFFVGALHSSYDFGPVALAAAQTDAQFVICGDGSSASAVRERFGNFANVVLPGWVSVSQAESLAQRSSVAVIPIAPHGDYQMNVTNKFYDAISKGLPVLTGRWGVLGRLVDEKRVGLTYTERSGETLADMVKKLESHPDLVAELSANASRLYDEQFRHADVYGQFVRHLESLASFPVSKLGS